MLLKDPVSRIIPRMALPTIMSFLINAIYSFTDTYFVSSLGTNATAAVSINSALDMLICMMGTLLAVGAASYIARLLGKDDPSKASRAFSTAFFLAMSFGTLLLVIGEAFTLPLVRFLGATATCERYAADYSKYMLIAAPFMPACFVMNHCLRSEGLSVRSMVGMCTSSIVNVILDPIFIFTLDMGIAGAAIATTISKVVMFIILVSHYFEPGSIITLSIRLITFSKDILFNIISVGAASFFRFGLDVLASIILNNIAGSISDSVLAGIGVCSKILLFPYGIIHGFCNGSLAVVGINWGAGYKDRVSEIRRFCSRVVVVGTLLMTVILIVFAKPLVARFAQGDAEMLHFGSICVIIQSASLPLYAWVFAVNTLCTGLGKGKYALILAMARQGYCFIPVLLIAAALFGAYGVIAAQPVADVLTMLLAIPIQIKLLKLIKAEPVNGVMCAVGT